MVESLFRKHFWAVDLLFLATLALLTARGVTRWAALALLPLPEVGSVEGTGAGRRATLSRTALDADLLYKAFGIPRPEPVAEAPAPPPPQDDPDAPPIHTSLHAKLIGTVLAREAQWSWAVIEDTSDHSRDVYMVRDTIQGATVLTIEEQQVVVLRDGHREIIDRDDPSSPVAAQPPPPAPIEEASDGSTIARSDVDHALNNLNELMMQARIVPAFRDGQPIGFKIFHIHPGSLYEKIGVQNGDVISRINGYDINSPEKALEVYSRLKDASDVDLDIQRGGSSVSKSYRIE